MFSLFKGSYFIYKILNDSNSHFTHRILNSENYETTINNFNSIATIL